MLTLHCDIRIKGKDTKNLIILDYVNEVDVKSLCKNLTDTAVVKLPRKMSWNGKPIYDFLRRDDAITILTPNERII